MVNATIDNDPVSIQLNGQSVTVPSNEVWKVKIGVHTSGRFSIAIINGVGRIVADEASTSPRVPEFDMVLQGGDTIEEFKGEQYSMVTIQGFVVKS
jgi:hypothetical protein